PDRFQGEVADDMAAVGVPAAEGSRGGSPGVRGPPACGVERGAARRRAGAERPAHGRHRRVTGGGAALSGVRRTRPPSPGDLGGGESTAPSLASGTRRLKEIPVEQIAVAKWTFDRPQVFAYAEPVGSGAYTDTDGLIGNTLLSRFTLYVDYPRKRLLFEPLK